jgi:hypothetical protein
MSLYGVKTQQNNIMFIFVAMVTLVTFTAMVAFVAVVTKNCLANNNIQAFHNQA